VAKKPATKQPLCGKQELKKLSQHLMQTYHITAKDERKKLQIEARKVCINQNFE